MQSVALHVFNSTYEMELRSILESTFHVHVRRDRALILDLLKYGRADALILELRDLAGRSTVPVIAQVKLSYPAIPVIGYVDVQEQPELMQLVPEAIRVGLTSIISHKRDDVRHVLRRIIVPAPWQVLTELFRTELEVLPNETIREFCIYVLDHAAHPMRFDEVIIHLGVDRTRLRETFRRHGMKPPRWFFSRVRMLAALVLLDSKGRRTEDVAVTLGFRSGDVLRRALVREVGVRARNGYDRNAFHRIVEAYREQLQLGKADHRRRRQAQTV